MKWNLRFLPASSLVLSLTARNAEALFGSSDQRWLWLVAPFLGLLLVGLGLVYSRRRVQARAWDARREPGELAVKGILLTTILVGLAVAIAFAIYNYRLEIDPRQKIWNIGLWFLGTTLGTSLALLLGLRRADRRG